MQNYVFVCDGETAVDWLTRYGFAHSSKSDIDNDSYWIKAFLKEANEWVKDRLAYA